MELRHLHYFKAVAEELNFGRAAERLNIAQPPLSRQIKDLEDELGTKLFERTNRTVELTNAGREFLKKTKDILYQVEQARITTKLASTGYQGELHIAYTETITDFIPVFKEFQQSYDSVGISLERMNIPQILKGLRDKTIDVGLLYVPDNGQYQVEPNKNIQVKRLKKVTVMAFLHKSNSLLKSESSINIQDLSNETFVMVSSRYGAFYEDIYEELFHSHEYMPKSIIQANDLHTALAIVNQGIGFTFASSNIQILPDIVKREVRDLTYDTQEMVLWNRDNHSGNLQGFLDLLHSYYD
ncbi:LysR family transcriptional regulator [Paenibacillus dokdonensis]|uniref:LysR family transcriptional regulator n=1 Tax=Paenibacillus dokdonensis TaxID=2567944 RepID=A0ABU6GSC2_9BACL|nr:LysR family transcriptional regulator [Paenibacillus dokdonensis]MEC0242616.1 LysR family transcriptional regulator [Paenibacillus dokdonensis]